MFDYVMPIDLDGVPVEAAPLIDDRFESEHILGEAVDLQLTAQLAAGSNWSYMTPLNGKVIEKAWKLGPDRKRGLGLRFGDEDHHPALVGEVEGVETQQFAHTGHLLLDGNARFVDANAHLGLKGDFIERGADTAPGGIAKHVNRLRAG